MEFILILMVLSMKDIGKTISNMELAKKFGWMVIYYCFLFLR